MSRRISFIPTCLSAAFAFFALHGLAISARSHVGISTTTGSSGAWLTTYQYQEVPLQGGSSSGGRIGDERELQMGMAPYHCIDVMNYPLIAVLLAFFIARILLLKSYAPNSDVQAHQLPTWQQHRLSRLRLNAVGQSLHSVFAVSANELMDRVSFV